MIPTNKHNWKPSTEFFVGSLYPSIYPWYCECGAFRKQDGTILEPSSHCKIEQCPLGTFCSTTQGKPDHMTPEECPLLKKFSWKYPIKEEVQ